MIGIECADIYLRFPEIMEEEFEDLTNWIEEEHIRYEGATDTFIDLQNEVKDLSKELSSLKNKKVKAVKQLKILLKLALEQDSENVNLIDRLRDILNILDGES